VSDPNHFDPLEQRVLICGSRTWDDDYLIRFVLAGLREHATSNMGKLVIIEGCAGGADHVACEWHGEQDPGVIHRHFPANWTTHGKKAGPLRNQQMLDEGRPVRVIAFSEHPITTGTADMIRRAKKAGIGVWVIGHG
jgi:hypothetical protein